MVSVVSSNPTGGNFIFLRHLDANFVQKCQKCQICVNYENLECEQNIFTVIAYHTFVITDRCHTDVTQMINYICPEPLTSNLVTVCLPVGQE